MTEYVYRKFPRYSKTIQALLQKDAAFSEICADYEEMCTWLDNYCQSKGRPSEECYRALEVIQDLEKEIAEAFKNGGP